VNFYKILNEEETHNGLKYHNGLNEDPLPFNPNGNCEPGGIYFAKEDILAFLGPGSTWIRQVTLPEEEPIYENPGSPKKWKAKRVILGPRRRINLQVIKQLVEDGANIHVDNDWPLIWAAGNGYLDIVEFLVEKGANIHIYNDEPLKLAAENNHVDVVKFLLDKGANVYANDNYVLEWAAERGYLDIIQFLANKGLNVYVNNNKALKVAADNGHLNIVKFLLDIKETPCTYDNETLSWATENGRLGDYVRILLKTVN